MKFISRFLALLFGLALGLAVFSWVVDQQFLQPAAFIKLIPSSTYSQLATALPATIGHSIDLTPSDQTTLGQYVDAGLMRQLVASTVTGELNYWHGHSTTPMLDLEPLAARINEAGAEISPALQSFLQEPQPITNAQLDKVIRPSVHRVDQLRYLAPLAALGLLVLIWFAGGRRRLRYLGEGCLVAATTVGVVILANLGLPSLVHSALGTSSLTLLAGPIKAALEAATRAVNHQLVEAMIGLVGAAVVLFIAQVLFGHRHGHR